MRSLRPSHAVALVLSLLALGATGTAVAKPHFYSPPPSSPRFDTYSSQTLAADFSGDGLVDLLHVRGYSRPFSVELAVAEGSRGAYGEIGIALDERCDHPGSAAAPDLDGDGDPDLAVSCDGESGGLAVFDNERGELVPVGLLTTGPRPGDVESADLDSDGDPDLLVSVAGADRVAAFENRGGSLERSDGFRLKDPGSIAVARFDADRDPDLAVSTGFHDAAVLIGRRGLDWRRTDVLHAPRGPLSLASGDLDGDGESDLALAGGENYGVTRLYSGDGTGRLEPTERFPRGGVRAIAVADVDGDGVDDLAVEKGLYAVVYSELDSARSERLRTWMPGLTIAVADLDSDGDADLAADHSYRTLALQRAEPRVTGDVGFDAEPIGSADAAEATASGDLDGDGVADLIAGGDFESSDAFSVYLGGTGSLSARPGNPFDADMGLLDIETGDFDADGRDSIVVAGYGGARVIETDSSGDPLPRASTIKIRYTTAVRAGDFDADGNEDIATVGETSRREYGLLVFWGDGAGGFVRSEPLELSTPSGPLVSADFDRDGIEDIAFQAQIGEPPALVPGSRSRILALEPGLTGEVGSPIAAPDLNADSRADLIVQAPRGSVAYLGAGPGGELAEPSGLEESVSNPLEFRPDAGESAIADFDLDGAADVVGVTGGGNYRFGGRRLSIRLGLGDGGFGRTASEAIDPGAPGGYIGALEAADFDGDGDPDIVAGDRDGAPPELYRNRAISRR